MRGISNAISLAALDSARIVGHIHIFTFPSSRMKNIGELIIYLHQDFQNVGLGTKLMFTALQFARERELHRIGLSVVADNRNAVHLYEKCGFKVEGERRNAYCGTDGQYHNMIEMGLVFESET